MCLLKKVLILFCFLTVTKCHISKPNLNDSGTITDPKIVQEKWTLLESRMKGFVQSAVKMLLPSAMEAFASLNVSSTCTRDVLKVVSGLKKMKPWAFKFLDASSKSIDGALQATFMSFGNYDECIDNEVVDDRHGSYQGQVLFRGKYCQVQLKPYLPPKPKRIRTYGTLDALFNFTTKDTVIGEAARIAHLAYFNAPRLALCVPSGCSTDDVNQVLKKAGDYLGIVFMASRCETKEYTKFTPAMITVIALYSVTGSLVVIASVVHVYSLYRKKTFASTPMRILGSFSFISNFQKFTDTSSSSSGVFSCLNGMRVITIIWIILGHTYYSFVLTVHKAQNLFYIVQQPTYQVIHTTVNVDTFFFMTGTLVCYNVTKLVKINKKPLNITMYILHRIWRILPVYAFVIAFYFLLPLMGSGPEFHNIMDHSVKSCEKNWWASMLFISNFYDISNICVFHGWYLSLDMQYHLGALLILIPLMRRPKLGITLAVVAIVASMIGSWVSTYIHDMLPTLNFSPDIELAVDTNNYYYVLPHAHAGPYCVGTLCGYLLAMHPKIKMPKALQIFGWCVSTAFCLSILYGGRRWNDTQVATFWETLFASSCYRVAWAMGVAWVVICCGTGHGGIANYILSLKIWIPLGRLSFLAYLIHYVVLQIYISTARTEVFTEHRTGVYMFFGHTVITFLLAFGGSMLVEAPFLSLEKVLLLKEPKQELSDTCKENSQAQHDSDSSKNNGMNVVLSGTAKDTEINNGVDNTAFVHKV